MAKDNLKFVGKLKKAVVDGDEKTVRRLIKGGVSVNVNFWGGGSLLHEAVITGNLEIVQILLDAGISPDGTLETGDTALHLASNRGHTDIVNTLLQYKANVNAKNMDNKSPLHFALWKRHPQVARLLINQGADVNCLDVDEWTPLVWAVKHPMFIDVAQMLIQRGASVNHQTSKGITPLHKSLAEGNFGAAKLLVQHGAEFYSNPASTTVMTSMLKHQNSPFVNSFNGNLHRLELEIRHNRDWHLSLIFPPGHIWRRSSNVSMEDPEANSDPKRRTKFLMPASLSHCCRKSIRLALGTLHKGKHIQNRVLELPLPDVLRRYIMYL